MSLFKNILRRFVLVIPQLLCCLLVSGCFQPEGENFIDVAKPDTGNIDIVLTDAVSELYIYKPSRLTYEVNEGSFQLIRLEGFIDSKSIRDPNHPSVLLVDPAQLSNGTHQLRIEATFTGQSGSLASKLGNEVHVISKQFNVVVDLETPDPVKANIEARNGSIYVSWARPTKTNFLNYSIHRYLKLYDNTWQEDINAKFILDPQVAGFNDSLFVGGSVKYRVDIRGYTSTREGIPADTTFSMVNPIVETTGDNTVTVSWPRSLFYKNLATIDVSQMDKPNISIDPTKATSYTTTIPFGSIYLQVISGSGKYGGGTSIYQDVFIGQELKFDGLPRDTYTYQHYGNQEVIIGNFGNPPNARLVSSVNHSVIKTVEFSPYYASARNPWAVQRSQYGMTPDGNNLYLFTGSEVIHFDSDLDLVEQIDFASVIATDDYEFAYSVKLSNNSIAAFNFYPSRIGIVDLKSNTIISENLPDKGAFNISPNGKFFFYDQKVYDISSGIMVMVATFTNMSYNLRDARFSSASDKLFLIYDPGHFVTVDTNTMAIISEFDIGNPGEYSLGPILYDPVSGLCGIQNSWVGSNSVLAIFNPVTKQIVKRLNVSDYCHLYNNTLYSGARLALPL